MDTIEGIIERAGGFVTVADRVRTTESAVRKWSKNGIPEKHWSALRCLTDVSPETLHELNERVRGDGGPSPCSRCEALD